jgi:hypothetical protein
VDDYLFCWFERCYGSGEEHSEMVKDCSQSLERSKLTNQF